MAGSGGAIHCITMQTPSAEYLHVLHYPLTNTDDTLNAYRVRAQITTSSNLVEDSALVYYGVNGGVLTSVSLAPVVDTPGVYAGLIPAQSAGDTVHYYLSVLNNDNITRTSPKHVPPQIYSFIITANPGLHEREMTGIPKTVSVFPNPVRHRLSFLLDVEKPARVRIAVYNALGQLARVVVDNELATGRNEIVWDLYDSHGLRVPQGVYFYSVTDGTATVNGKILLTE
jgi:hypothetical protein